MKLYVNNYKLMEIYSKVYKTKYNYLDKIKKADFFEIFP